jgi:hypothetical protein
MSFLRNKTRESNTTIGHARPVCSSNNPATPMPPPVIRARHAYVLAAYREASGGSNSWPSRGLLYQGSFRRDPDMNNGPT